MVYKYESSHDSTEMPRKLGRSHLPDCAPADAGVPAPDEITWGRPFSAEEIARMRADLQRVCMQTAFHAWKMHLYVIRM